MRIKTLFIALFFLLLLTLFLAYRTYSSYAALNTIARDTRSLGIMRQAATVVDKTGEEAFQSARYLGVKGVNYLDKLKASRGASDEALRGLRGAVANDARALIPLKRVEHFQKEITKARLGMDTLNITDEKHLYPLFQSQAVVALMGEISSWRSALTRQEVAQKVDAYARLLYQAKSLADERALLAYFLAKRTRLNPPQMEMWERVLEAGAEADFSVLADRELARRLEKTLNNSQTLERLFAVRSDLFLHAKDGEFTTQLYDIEEIFAKPMSSIYQTSDVLRDDILQTIARTKTDEKSLLTMYLFGAILSLIISGLLWRFVRSSSREKRVLEESLREITRDLDEERRKELAMIMDKGDRAAIYRFLSGVTLEARSAEERAHQAERAKDLFLANMSHEIRTPLNGILGFSQLMLSTPLNAEQHEFMGVIGSSSENLLRIVNDILDLSKIHAEKIELEHRTFSLIKDIEKAIEPHAARALEKEIEYSTFVDPSLPLVTSDSTKITQIMTNLIGNAMKFTNEGGTVDVDVRKIKEDPGQVLIRFSVKDSGIGISPEKLTTIFEPFAQADAGTTRQFGGTGLGLTITRDIIKHMGGVLSVESEVDRGSEFYFELLFESAGEDEPIQDRLKGLHIAYYHSGHATLRQMERNLALYVRASGARYRTIGSHELDLMEDVDILVLDYSDHETRDNIETLLSLGKKTLLISTVAHEHQTDNLAERVGRILYRPLTTSKFIRACEAIDAPQEARSAAKTYADSTSFEGLSILVAEDNLINQKLIERVLQDMRIVPVLVRNGQEALTLRKSQKFDAILMDVQMPVMGGVEASHAILAYEKEQHQVHVPIIALTANALRGDREKYINEGMDDYISKPINLDQLRKVLQEHCSPTPVSKSTPTAAPQPIAPTDAPPATQPSAPCGEGEPATILMYSRGGELVLRIHRDALQVLGHTLISAETEEAFLSMLSAETPRCVLFDTHSISLESCTAMETAQNSGAHLFAYALPSYDVPCNVSAEPYLSVSELLHKLS